MFLVSGTNCFFFGISRFRNVRGTLLQGKLRGPSFFFFKMAAFFSYLHRTSPRIHFWCMYLDAVSGRLTAAKRRSEQAREITNNVVAWDRSLGQRNSATTVRRLPGKRDREEEEICMYKRARAVPLFPSFFYSAGSRQEVKCLHSQDPIPRLYYLGSAGLVVHSL